MIRNAVVQLSRAAMRDIARHSSWYSLAAMFAATFAVEIVRERERVRAMLADLTADMDARTDAIIDRMLPAIESEHDARTTITDDDVREITQGRYRG